MSSPQQPIVQALLDRLRSDHAAGRVSDARLQSLSNILRQQGDLLDAPSETVEQAADNLARQRDLIAKMSPLIKDPSHGLPAPPAASRAADVVRRLSALKSGVADLANRTGEGPTTRQHARRVLIELSEVHAEVLRSAADDRATLRLERERVRSVAAEARRLASSYHLTLAAPIFDTGHVTPQRSQTFFSGPDSVRTTVAAACSTIAMELQAPQSGSDYAVARWRQLRSAGVGVFAFCGDDPSVRASVAYEFGLARALGLPVVVLHDDRRPAFDVAVQALRVRDDDRDGSAISAAIDDALYGLAPVGDRHEGLRATVRDLAARFGDCAAYPNAAPLVKRVVAQLEEPDPRAISSAIEAVLLDTGERRLELIHPAWPAVYPEPGQTRVFHVMPFGPTWSRTVSEHVQRLCPPGTYRRHDHNDERNIIDSLWREVSSASHVVVDITPDDSRGEPRLNENVAVELGFADALGRPVLLVAQRGTVAAGLIPSLEKQRVEEYDVDDPEALSRSIRRFVSIPPSPPSTDPTPPGGTARAPIPSGSPSVHRPGLAEIRRQLDAALQHDAHHRWLEGWLRNIGHTDPRHVYFLVGLVRRYVGTTADALDGMWRLAVDHGVATQVDAIVVQIEAYCRRLDDIIPDAHGLFGVVDDAYLARQIVAGIGWQLRGDRVSEHEWTSTWYVRQQVIREPFARQLDALVDQILRGQPAVTAAQNLAQAGAQAQWTNNVGQQIERGVQSVVDAVANVFTSKPRAATQVPPPAPHPWWQRLQHWLLPTHPLMETLAGLRKLIELAEAARQHQAQQQTNLLAQQVAAVQSGSNVGTPSQLQAQFDGKMLDYQVKMAQLDRQSRERLEVSRSSMLSSASAAGIDVSGW